MQAEHSTDLSADAQALYEGFKHMSRTGGLPTFGYAMMRSKLDFVAGLRALQELKDAGLVEDYR